MGRKADWESVKPAVRAMVIKKRLEKVAGMVKFDPAKSVEVEETYLVTDVPGPLFEIEHIMRDRHELGEIYGVKFTADGIPVEVCEKHCINQGETLCQQKNGKTKVYIPHRFVVIFKDNMPTRSYGDFINSKEYTVNDPILKRWEKRLFGPKKVRNRETDVPHGTNSIGRHCSGIIEQQKSIAKI